MPHIALVNIRLNLFPLTKYSFASGPCFVGIIGVASSFATFGDPFIDSSQMVQSIASARGRFIVGGIFHNIVVGWCWGARCNGGCSRFANRLIIVFFCAFSRSQFGAIIFVFAIVVIVGQKLLIFEIGLVHLHLLAVVKRFVDDLPQFIGFDAKILYGAHVQELRQVMFRLFAQTIHEFVEIFDAQNQFRNIFCVAHDLRLVGLWILDFCLFRCLCTTAVLEHVAFDVRNQAIYVKR